VLLSSSGSSPLIPIPERCIEIDSIGCAEEHGGLFNYDCSSKWHADNFNHLPPQVELSLGYSGNSLVAFENVTLGWTGCGGPTLNNTLVMPFLANWDLLPDRSTSPISMISTPAHSVRCLKPRKFQASPGLILRVQLNGRRKYMEA
jgi:hypothetical protein